MILKVDLEMRKFNQKRTIHILLPDDYLYSQKRYPVLYMFDGHNLFSDSDATFGTSWRLGETLRNKNIEMIIVGQECSHRGNDRIIEYSPYPFADEALNIQAIGRGDLTMDFFINDLKPYIDTHFPTLPFRETTWIAGSSCGGTMALYAGLRYASYYSKIVSLSPYIINMQDSFLMEANRCYFDQPTNFYISWGAFEYDKKHAFVQETAIVTELANRIHKRKGKVYLHCKPEGEHTEADWGQEAYLFLDFLMNNE